MNGITLNETMNFVRACESVGTCVEVAKLELYAIRGSKDPDHLVVVEPDEWKAFIRGAKAGEFDNI